MNKAVEISTGELEEVLSVLKHQYGYDFTDYARASLTRRFQKFMTDANIRSGYDLKYQLVNNAATFQHFLQTVTVNVTELFRDPQYYKTLHEKVFPMLASYPIIKIWHAGCSTGEEVFSTCILLKEAGLLDRAKIYATDINPKNLEKAKAGILPLHVMKDYTTNYIQSGGTKEFADYYTARYNNAIIKKELRDHVVFSQHNLVTDNTFNEFQLICCRNVMIYFNRHLQHRVMQLFYDSLSPLGFIALGAKESLLHTDIRKKFETVNSAAKIFRRKE